MVNISCLELNSEYSRTFHMTAGVLQGSASSTILFMAYTSDIIELFNRTFPAEEIIQLYHVLLHADDCLILSTCKKRFIEKFKCLESYCVENKIKLQPLKCSFLAINTDENENITLTNGIIKNMNQAVYLGSLFSSWGSVKYDVILEIQKRQKHFNKFFAFLRENYNAPISVKERVLEACVSSAALYNCESWGDANIDCLEDMYRKALKYMLVVRSQVCNEFPYIELGKPTLKSVVQKRQYTFYKMCVGDSDWPLQRYIIRKAMDVNCSYIRYYTRLANIFTSPILILETNTG